MNKVIIISIIFVFFLSLTATSQAQSEFTEGILVFPDNAGSTPHDPKVDCHPNGDHCLLMFYDQFTETIKFKFSWNNGHHYEGLVFQCTGFDFFLGCNEVASVSNSLSASHTRLEDLGEFHLPYDVTWVNEDNTYYAFIENVDYTYVPSGAFSTLRTNPTFYWGLQFINETTYFQIRTIHNAGPTNDWHLRDIRDWSSQDTGTTPTTGACSGTATTNYATENLIGFSAVNDGTLLYRIWYGYNSQNCSDVTQGTVPEITGPIGMSYYLDNTIQYTLNHNETKEATTTDFSSYTSATVVYTWNESEYINSSMSDKIDTNQLYVYELNNETGTISGIYVYNEQQYPLIVSMGIQDPDRGGQFQDINTSGAIVCLAENYTQTDTGGAGDPLEFTTPCLTGNTIVIQTIEGLPANFSFEYDVLSGCESQSTYIYTPLFEGYVGYYNLTVRVRDSIFNSGVPGATVTLSGDSQVTDSSGNAYFQIAPISNADFTTETDAGSCIYELSITGSERIYNLFASRSGYKDYTENSLVLGEDPFSLAGGDFTTVKTIIMDQEGAQAEVHVYSSDGIELFPSVVEVEASGSNNTFVNNLGELIESNISFSVPALFQLIDTRATFPVNFTLKYFHGEDFDYYHQNVTVVQEGFHIVNFYINENFANLKCTNDIDCPESVCSGTYFKQFSSCTDNLCTYTSERCLASNRCDPVKGCFDIQYVQACELDAECEDACLTNFSMTDKSCGSEDLCIGKTVECSTNCSVSYGVCSELLDCLYPDTDEFRLVFPSENQDAFFQAVREDITCNFDNAGDSFCVSQNIELLDTVGINWWLGLGSTSALELVTADPEDWNYIRNDADTGYIFYGVSATCSDTCGLTFEYCQDGCNTDSGKCIGEIEGEQQVYDDWIEQGFAWINSLIPFQYRILAWLFFSIGVMFYYRQGIKGHQGGDKDTMLVGFIVFLAGVGIGWVHWIFLFIIGFVISFVLWEKYIHK